MKKLMLTTVALLVMNSNAFAISDACSKLLVQKAAATIKTHGVDRVRTIGVVVDERFATVRVDQSSGLDVYSTSFDIKKDCRQMKIVDQTVSSLPGDGGESGY
jgi:hypothetical protein